MRGEFVDLDGARLYYYAAGTRGAGEPVVFLHGFPTSGHLWSEVAPLVPPGHRVIVMDLLGYGRSDLPRGRSVSVRAHAERVVALFDVLGIARACVVGHDMGGGIAQQLATRHANRVSALCLVNSIAFADWPTRILKLARAALPLTRHLPPAWVLPLLRMEVVRGYMDEERGQHSVERYIRAFSTPDGRDALVAHLRALDATDTATIASSLRDIAVPTSIVWGREDPFLPFAFAERLHQVIPGSTIDLIAGARHFTPEECPHRVADAIAALLAHT